MDNKLKKAVILLAGAALLVSGAALVMRGGVSVIIRNAGSGPLRSVVVHVTGNAYPVGDIGPGEQKTIRVFATGESHVELEFGNGGRLFIGCYFEEGYQGKITAEVTADRVLRVKDEIRIGPF